MAGIFSLKNRGFAHDSLYRRGGICAILGHSGPEWVCLGQQEAKMSIGSSFNGINSVYGVTQTAPAAKAKKSSATSSVSSFGDDEATVSSTGSAFSAAAAGGAERSGKVASVQAAIARGYRVPPSAVATRMVDFMLGKTA
jgi:anti-sigma28 factor (negative regulator of flagellin synthesis)